MNKLILMAGAAALLSTTPALAEKGKGNSGAKANVAAKVHSGKAKASKAKATNRRMVDVNRNGVADWRERFIDRDRDGIDDRREANARRYGGAVCPPGLEKKTPACVPPGQASRMFREGQRLPSGYRYYTDFDDIPLELRTRYTLDDDYRYIYRDNRIYVVDPQTSLITRIISAIL